MAASLASGNCTCTNRGPRAVSVPTPRWGRDRWPAAPVTRLGPTSKPEPERPRGLVRRSPLSAAPPTPPRRPRLYPPSPCMSHASQTRPGDRKEHGTQGGTGRGAENSRTEDGTERGPRTPAPGGPAIAPGGGSRLTRLGETTRLRVRRPPTPAPPGFCPPPSPDGRACTEKPPFQPGHAREPKVVFFALFC